MENGKKKLILVILVIFPIYGNKEKKFIIMKKNFVQKTKIEFWATTQVYCKARQLGWALG